MRKSTLFYFGISLFIGLQGCGQNLQANKAEAAISLGNLNENEMTKNILDFIVKDIEGKDFAFASLKGKKVMIVNTASKCGLTPQYKELEDLYQKFKNQNFVIIGFPANSFGSQEPGTNKEISVFCQKNYGVTFPMMEKISVKGEDMHELYQYLTNKSQNGLIDAEVEWNFQKFLINENGQLEKVVSPRISPLSDEIVNWIRG
jgi:glutathione peroxidase